MNRPFFKDQSHSLFEPDSHRTSRHLERRSTQPLKPLLRIDSKIDRFLILLFYLLLKNVLFIVFWKKNSIMVYFRLRLIDIHGRRTYKFLTYNLRLFWVDPSTSKCVKYKLICLQFFHIRRTKQFSPKFQPAEENGNSWNFYYINIYFSLFLIIILIYICE